MSALKVIGLDHVVAVAILLFGMGLYTVLTRRSAAGALSGTALMLQAAGLELVAMHAFGAGVGAGSSAHATVDGALVLASLLAAASGGTAAIAAALIVLGRARPGARTSPRPRAGS